MAKRLTKRNKDKENQPSKHFNLNIFALVIIVLIILTFVITGSSWLGIGIFMKDVGKKIEKNPDGTVSIPADAQSPQAKPGQDLYIGKVLGEEIKFGVDDDFTRNFENIKRNPNMNPYEKYQMTRYIFNQAIDQIIGMHDALKMNIKITSDSDYFIKEIGKRFFTDAEGDIDYDYMRKNKAEVNRKGATIIKDLIYDIFRRDHFMGLPISNEELLDNYKMDDSKVRINFINISNKDVDIQDVLNYYNKNIALYRKYKLIRLVFKNRDDAQNALFEIKKDPTKFNDISRKLKEENKASVVYDPDYSFINDFEDKSLQDAVKNTQVHTVGSSVVDTKIGPIVFYVDDMKEANFSSDTDYNKIKNDYIQNNISAIEKNNKAKAEAVYDYAVKNGLDAAAKKFNVTVVPSKTDIKFMENDFENNMELYFDFDKTDDVNFVVSLFKSDAGKVVPVRKYSDGYMIAEVIKKSIPTYNDFVNSFDYLNEKYSRQKSMFLEQDYYDLAKEKYRIVDNFKYCITPQMFLPEKGTDQDQ